MTESLRPSSATYTFPLPSPASSISSHSEFIQELGHVDEREYSAIRRETPLNEALSDKATPQSNAHSEPERFGKRRTRRYGCLNSDCDRRFISEYTRKVHMDGVHNPKPRKMLACSMGCGELFGRRHDRLRHEVAQHGKVNPFLGILSRNWLTRDRRLSGL
jgi:hypothetical protein